MEHLKEQPKKPILVHEHHDDDHTKQHRKKSITWDEEGIEAYDKERNKIPKITEAKTPFAPDLAEDQVEEITHDVDAVLDETTKENTVKNKHITPGLDPDELHRKILEKTSPQKEREREREEEEEDAQAEKHRAFMEKRKKHYDEGSKLKQILKKTLEKDDDDDEDKHKDKDKNDKDDDDEK